MATRRKAARADERSCYVLELSIQPGGARRGELVICTDLRVVRRKLELELLTASDDERRGAAVLLLSEQLVTLWVVEDGRVTAGIDLRPLITLAIDQQAPRTIPDAILAELAGTLPLLDEVDELRFAIDWDAITRQVPTLRGPLLAAGETATRHATGDAILCDGSYLAGLRSLRLGVHDREHGPDGPLLLAPGDDPFVEPAANDVGVARDGDEAALLEAIYGAPLEDAPRERYAAWLDAQGDPRGEFIRLQLGRSRGTLSTVGARREKTLLKEHHAHWSAPIPALVASGATGGRVDPAGDDARSLEVPTARLRGLRFERGFVVDVPGLTAPVRRPELLSHPVWASVRRLAYTEFVTPAMRALETVSGPDSLLLSLHEVGHRLEHVHLHACYPPVPVLAASASPVRHLRLELSDPAMISEWLAQLRVASPELETLTFVIPDGAQFGASWDWSLLDGAWLTRLEFAAQREGGRFVLERRDDVWSMVSYRTAADRSDAWYGVLDALAPLATHRVATLAITFGARFEDTYVESIRAQASPLTEQLTLTLPDP